VPISSTLLEGVGESACVINATTCGLLKVWPQPIGRVRGSYARSRKVGGTKSSRGIRSMARSTTVSVTPE
jgi:hypothetical protein